MFTISSILSCTETFNQIGKANKRMISPSSGNEIEANDWWRPAGRTFPGDIPEVVMKDISSQRGEHTWNIVN